ncbi:MAG TPA: EAL domain-containing protein [Vicinamibacterales bacterium]|nr:EAL domain-containing protein [Vicinamibacterales bacterium]
MSRHPAHLTPLTTAAAAVGGALLLGLSGWPPRTAGVAYACLVLAALLNSILENRRPTKTDAQSMPLSFVIDFTALLLLGPIMATLVAVVGAVTLTSGHSRTRPACANIGTSVAAIQTAGLAHSTLGGALGYFDWPWHAVSVGAAAMTYCLVRIGSAAIVTPLLTNQPVNLQWSIIALRSSPNYILGASVVVVIVEIINQQAWKLFPVIAVPLFFLYKNYVRYLDRLDREHRGLEVVESLDQGMCFIDVNGQITLWNDALQRILNCPRERALGHPIVVAVPVLGKTEFPRAVAEALLRRTPRTFPNFRLPSSTGALTLQVKILPDVGGVTVLWHDVTEQALAEHRLQRSEERLALMEAGANDGLWEWNLARRELHVSARWRSMVGLPAASANVRPEDWFERVHADDIESLKQAIDAHLSGQTDELRHEHRVRHEDGTYRRFLCHGIAVRGANRRAARIAGSMTDVTEYSDAQEQLRSAGFRDQLTGLWTRAPFVEELGQRLAAFKQRRGGRFAALYIDLDRFKVVNDSLGHQVGDELLVAVSRRLESCLREGDTIARLGGDEFALLLNSLDDEGQANAIAFRIQDALNVPFSIGGREVFTSASIGITFSASQYNNPEEIIRDADSAMYQAKASGKARHEVFDADMRSRALDRLGLENDLRHAVTDTDFEVHYQPIVSLTSGMCVGFEALVRWTRNGVTVAPDKFIPVAEELGLIEPLGTWVLREACRTFADWQRRFPQNKLECITVNVSTRQLMQQNFLHIVEQAVHEARMTPADLRLEITETTLMGSPFVAADALRQLQDFGVKIYLDDFGTGYSSLSHLHKLPVDALKIDRSFVRSLLLPDRPAIVESILALARTLDTGVVAEGVESDVQARELERLGCRHAQGYYFSPPLSREAAEELLASHRRLGDRGPSTRSRAIETQTEVFFSSAPFEWPDDANPDGAPGAGPRPRGRGDSHGGRVPPASTAA